MKIIFLDIDGVLNVISQGYDSHGSIFHDHFVENLRMIIDVTGAKIVLSSSWRKDGIDKIREMWIARNLPGEIIDLTPSLYLKKGGSIQFWNGKLSEHPTPKIRGYSVPRGCEIEYWINDNEEKIESYVIIDDDQDMLYNQRDNFVCCSENFDHSDAVEGYGLTKENSEKAISILMK